MPKVPTIQVPQVKEAGFPDVKSNIKTSEEAFGGGQGKVTNALLNLGKDVSLLMAKQKEEADHTIFLDAARKYELDIEKKEIELKNHLGGNAKYVLNKGLEYETERYNDITAGLYNDNQKAKFDAYALSRRDGLRKSLNNHMTVEMNRYDQEMFNAHRELNINKARLSSESFKDINSEFAKNLEKIQKMHTSRARRKGTPMSAAGLDARKDISKAYRDSIDSFINMGDSKSARALYEHKSRIVPEAQQGPSDPNATGGITSAPVQAPIVRFSKKSLLPDDDEYIKGRLKDAEILSEVRDKTIEIEQEAVDERDALELGAKVKSKYQDDAKLQKEVKKSLKESFATKRRLDAEEIDAKAKIASKKLQDLGPDATFLQKKQALNHSEFKGLPKKTLDRILKMQADRVTDPDVLRKFHMLPPEKLKMLDETTFMDDYGQYLSNSDGLAAAKKITLSKSSKESDQLKLKDGYTTDERISKMLRDSGLISKKVSLKPESKRRANEIYYNYEKKIKDKLFQEKQKTKSDYIDPKREEEIIRDVIGFEVKIKREFGEVFTTKDQDSFFGIDETARTGEVKAKDIDRTYIEVDKLKDISPYFEAEVTKRLRGIQLQSEAFKKQPDIQRYNGEYKDVDRDLIERYSAAKFYNDRARMKRIEQDLMKGKKRGR